MPSLRRSERVPSAHGHPTAAPLLNPPLAALRRPLRRPLSGPDRRPLRIGRFWPDLLAVPRFPNCTGLYGTPRMALPYPSSDDP